MCRKKQKKQYSMSSPLRLRLFRSTDLSRKIRKDRKDELILTQSVLIKFQGQNFPRAFIFMHVSFPVLPYISCVLMCFARLRFGHVDLECNSSLCEMWAKQVCWRILVIIFPPKCCNCGLGSFSFF